MRFMRPNTAIGTGFPDNPAQNGRPVNRPAVLLLKAEASARADAYLRIPRALRRPKRAYFSPSSVSRTR